MVWLKNNYKLTFNINRYLVLKKDLLIYCHGRARAFMDHGPRRPAARRLTLSPTPASRITEEEVDDWEDVAHWGEEASLSIGKEDRRRADRWRTAGLDVLAPNSGH